MRLKVHVCNTLHLFIILYYYIKSSVAVSLTVRNCVCVVICSFQYWQIWQLYVTSVDVGLQPLKASFMMPVLLCLFGLRGLMTASSYFFVANVQDRYVSNRHKARWDRWHCRDTVRVCSRCRSICSLQTCLCNIVCCEWFDNTRTYNIAVDLHTENSVISPNKAVSCSASKSHELPTVNHAGTNETLRNKVVFDPRPATQRHHSATRPMHEILWFRTKVTTLDQCLSAQLYAPANVHALECNHDYLKDGLSSRFAVF